MDNFKLELLGDIRLTTYFAWKILSFVGAFTATIIRNHLTTLKSYPFSVIRSLTVFLLTFIVVRFSYELTGLVPSAFGAFIVGLSGNEIALNFLNKISAKKINLVAKTDGDGAITPSKGL